MKMPLIFMLGLLTLVTNVKADFYDRCNGILAQGIYNTYVKTGASEDKMILKKWLCSSSESTKAGGGNVEVSVFELFSVGGGGEGLSSWKKNNCNQEDSSYQGSRSSHLFIQQVSQDIVEAWKACVLKDPESNGLVCLGKETNNNLIISVSLKYGLGDMKGVNIDYVNLFPVFNVNEVTKISGGGEYKLLFKNSNTSEESIFVLNGKADYLQLSCEYVVAPKLNFSTKNECENLRLKAYTENQIDQSELVFLRKHNMFPLYKNGLVVGTSYCKFFF